MRENFLSYPFVGGSVGEINKALLDHGSIILAESGYSGTRESIRKAFESINQEAEIIDVLDQISELEDEEGEISVNDFYTHLQNLSLSISKDRLRDLLLELNELDVDDAQYECDKNTDMIRKLNH